MTKDFIVKAIKGIMGQDVFVEVSPESTTVTTHGMYSEMFIDYDAMLMLSQALGTTNINVRYNSGWGGTECTPGDSPTCELFIGVGAI